MKADSYLKNDFDLISIYNAIAKITAIQIRQQQVLKDNKNFS